jgi:hypothetical protein
MPAKPIEKKQLKAIFGLGKPLGFGYDELHELALDRTGHGLSEMTFTEADAMIQNLGGTPFKRRGLSRRAEQYRRQKTGVKRMASAAPSHLDLMRQWGVNVGFDEAALKSFILNQLGHDWPRTTVETSRIIQTLKSMHGRGWRAGQEQQKEAA